jgi:hypothetical protein
MLDSGARKAQIAQARGAANALAAEHMAIDALANRRPPEPAPSQSWFHALTPRAQVITIFRHCLAGQHAAAGSLMEWIPGERRDQEPYRLFLSWAAGNCRAR